MIERWIRILKNLGSNPGHGKLMNVSVSSHQSLFETNTRLTSIDLDPLVVLFSRP